MYQNLWYTPRKVLSGKLKVWILTLENTKSQKFMCPHYEVRKKLNTKYIKEKKVKSRNQWN